MKCMLNGPCPYEKDGNCTNKNECEMQETYKDPYLKESEE